MQRIRFSQLPKRAITTHGHHFLSHEFFYWRIATKLVNAYGSIAEGQNPLEQKKRPKIPLLERRILVDSFIKGHRDSNNGTYPTISCVMKETGTSFHFAKNMLVAIKSEDAKEEQEEEEEEVEQGPSFKLQQKDTIEVIRTQLLEPEEAIESQALLSNKGSNHNNGPETTSPIMDLSKALPNKTFLSRLMIHTPGGEIETYSDMGNRIRAIDRSRISESGQIPDDVNDGKKPGFSVENIISQILSTQNRVNSSSPPPKIHAERRQSDVYESLLGALKPSQKKDRDRKGGDEILTSLFNKSRNLEVDSKFENSDSRSEIRLNDIISNLRSQKEPIERGGQQVKGRGSPTLSVSGSSSQALDSSAESIPLTVKEHLVCISDMPQNTDLAEIKRILSGCGEVISMHSKCNDSGVWNFFLEFKTVEAMEAALSIGRFNINGHPVYLSRLHPPTTSVVRIRNISANTKITKVLQVCQLHGTVAAVKAKGEGVVDVYFDAKEIGHISSILHRLNEVCLNQNKWQANTAPIFTSDTVRFLESSEEGHRKLIAQNIHVIGDLLKNLKQSVVTLEDLQELLMLECPQGQA